MKKSVLLSLTASAFILIATPNAHAADGYSTSSQTPNKLVQWLDKGWDKTKDTTEKVWDKTKDTSKKAWENINTSQKGYAGYYYDEEGAPVVTSDTHNHDHAHMNDSKPMVAMIEEDINLTIVDDTINNDIQWNPEPKTMVSQPVLQQIATSYTPTLKSAIETMPSVTYNRQPQIMDRHSIDVAPVSNIRMPQKGTQQARALTQGYEAPVAVISTTRVETSAPLNVLKRVPRVSM